MLSLSNVSSGHAASQYYAKEGYYFSDSPEAERSAIFYGKAADEAGLTNSFSEATFQQILEGVTPDGRVLGRWRDGEREHRPGIDLTFSAPKGVSIAALIGGDKRLIEAHTAAVKTALDYAEKNLLVTRRTVNGAEERTTGAKMIAALFQHDTSRAMDPELHTHAIITNMVKDDTGTYRSMSNEKIYKAKMLLGQIYRNDYAARIEALGYETQKLEKNLFDLKHIPEELTGAFSKRRKEILASLEKRNQQATPQASAMAALATRASKKPVERSELHKAWREEVRELGYDPDRIISSLSERSTLGTQTPDQSLAQKATDFAVDHLKERNAVYAHDAVLKTALEFAPTVSHRDVEKELVGLIDHKALFPVTLEGEKFYTDAVNVKLETENNRMMTARQGRTSLDLRSTRDKLLRLKSDAAINEKLERTTLSADQKEAAKTVLSAKDLVVGVQGYAGTGKTYMLATTLRMANARGYQMDGLAPSHKAVKALNESIPNSATIESALTRHENGANLGDKSKTILVVDEASMLSSEGMNRVLKMAREQGYAKLALVGDIDQLEAVGAGSAFRALQRAGMRLASMIDIRRQRTQKGRETVLSIIGGDVQKAMDGITDIVQTGGRDGLERRALVAQKLSETYSALSAPEREKTGLIVLTNAMRRSVNDAVQSDLKAQGEIGSKSTSIPVLVPRHFTQAEASEIRSYRAGDIVVAPVAHKKSGLVSNTLYRVSAIEKDTSTLTLQDPGGEKIDLELSSTSRVAQRLAVFKPETQTFYSGDQVKFKITDREHGVFNSEEGKIASIGRDTVVVATKEGADLTVPIDSLAAKGMQLAYATTAHDFQGSTIENVLLGMVSKERLSTLKSFYVAVSRMVETTKLITDNAGDLASKIHGDTGKRINGLEALAEEKSYELDRAKDDREAAEIFREIAKVTGSDRDHMGRKIDPSKDQKSDEKTRTEETDTNPEKASEKEDKQMSFMDQLKRDQKTRDERSR